MHIIILPSEEFVPDDEPLAGIFQLDQARILAIAGYKVGVISVRLRFSFPMILKAICKRLFLLKSNNKTDDYSFGGLCNLLYQKICFSDQFITLEKKGDINVVRAEGFYWLPPSSRYDHLWWKQAGRRAYKYYKKTIGHPDIIHVHNAVNAGLLALQIKRKNGIPYLITEHSSYFARGLYSNNLVNLARRVYENADTVFTVSNFLGGGLQQFFPRLDYEVLPNVVSPEFEFSPLDSKPEAIFSFISIGNLIRLKRHDMLIKAFHEAFKDGENVCLDIIGEGEERKNLTALVDSLGESERVRLRGLYNKEQILETLNHCDVLSLQSEYETFGVVVLEALFRGVPVIATRCGGPEEVVGEGDGILIDKDNEKQLVSALQKMYATKDEYDSAAIRERAIEGFGANRFLKSLLPYYEKYKRG